MMPTPSPSDACTVRPSPEHDSHAKRRRDARTKALVVAAFALISLGAGSACTVESPAPAQTCDGGDCTSTPTPEAGVDARPAPSTPPPPPPSSCYVEDDQLEIRATAPALQRGLCTNAQISALVACLEKGDCKATIDANKDCARCAIGAQQGDDPATTPLGAIIPVSETDAVVATLACAAVAVGKPECALELSNTTICLESTCATCDDDGREACLEEASKGACKSIATQPCVDAIDAGRASWQPRCTDATPFQAFGKVAALFCGSSSADGGTD